MKRPASAVVAVIAIAAAWFATRRSEPLPRPPDRPATPIVEPPVPPRRAAPKPLPLVVRLIDGETGAAIDEGDVQVGGHESTRRDGAAFRWDETRIHGGETWPLFVHATARGYAASEEGTVVHADDSATVLEWTLVMRREIDLVVDVSGAPHWNASDARAWVEDVEVDGSSRPGAPAWRSKSEQADGRLVVRGVPFIRGAAIRVRASVAEGGGLVLDGGSGVAETRLGATSDAPCRIAVNTLTGVPVWDYDRQDWAREFVTSKWFSSERNPIDDPFGGVESPNAPRCKTSPHEAGDASSAVTVVDESGRPLVGAAVHAFDGPAARDPVDERPQIEDGVQRVVPRTGIDGKLRLRGLRRGQATVHVAWDVRSADVSVVAGEDVRVVLRPAKR